MTRTLREQVADVVIRHVNEPYLNAAGLPRAADYMAQKAFTEDWPRDSFDARVVLRWFEMMSGRWGCVPEDFPGV